MAQDFWMVELELLGTLMVDNSHFACVEGLLPEHFADPFNAMIFDELTLLFEAGQLADGPTVLPRLLELGLAPDHNHGWRTHLAWAITLWKFRNPCNCRELAGLIGNHHNGSWPIDHSAYR
jgi:DnaB-like helicase N terminal domain